MREVIDCADDANEVDDDPFITQRNHENAFVDVHLEAKYHNQD